METLSKPPFQGFRFPNTTPVPDELFDELLAELSGAELKVLLYICRRTFGFKKESDTISLNQMIHGIQRKDTTWLDKGTGLSRDSVTRALKDLEQRGVIITVKKQSETKGNEVNTYQLNIRAAATPDDPSSENRTRGGVKIGLGVVRKSDPQETVVQETVIQPTVFNTVRRAGKIKMIHGLPDIDQPQEKRNYIAQSIVDALGDQQSLPFYRLVASKVPERVIRYALAEIKADGARQPERVFTYRMQQYALDQHKKTLYTQPIQPPKKRP
jgi:phage replication O-like protein O